MLALVLMALLVRGCLEARQQRGFEDYVREVSSLVAESGQESEAFFGLLEDPEELSAVDVQNNLNGFSVDAQRLVDRARATDPPDQLAETHDLVVQTLELRRGGLEGIARGIPPALGGEQRNAAIESIAADMQSFLASDVVYAEQAVPGFEETLEAEDLADEVDEVPESRFLPGIEWLQPEVVRDAVNRIRAGEGAAEGEEDPIAGDRGTGLAGVTVQPSGQALTEGAATEIALAEGLAFDVQVENQGQGDEQDVGVRVTISGAQEPLVLETSLDAIPPGTTQTATVTLDETPPTDTELEVAVEIEPVPGEAVVENNEGTFGVIFTGER